MYTVKHGGDIHKGDLIAVCNTNDFCVGIYYGRGTGGTVQYFYPSAVVRCRDYYEERLKNLGPDKMKPFKIGNVWKCYINSPRDTRILKLNRDNITDQKELENILEAKEILKQFNVQVNF